MASSYDRTGFAIIKELAKRAASRTMSNREKQPLISGNNISLCSGHCPRLSALQQAFGIIPFPFLLPDASRLSYPLCESGKTTCHDR